MSTLSENRDQIQWESAEKLGFEPKAAEKSINEVLQNYAVAQSAFESMFQSPLVQSVNVGLADGPITTPLLDEVIEQREGKSRSWGHFILGVAEALQEKTKQLSRKLGEERVLSSVITEEDKMVLFDTIYQRRNPQDFSTLRQAYSDAKSSVALYETKVKVDHGTLDSAEEELTRLREPFLLLDQALRKLVLSIDHLILHGLGDNPQQALSILEQQGSLKDARRLRWLLALRWNNTRVSGVPNPFANSFSEGQFKGKGLGQFESNIGEGSMITSLFLNTSLATKSTQILESVLLLENILSKKDKTSLELANLKRVNKEQEKQNKESDDILLGAALEVFAERYVATTEPSSEELDDKDIKQAWEEVNSLRLKKQKVEDSTPIFKEVRDSWKADYDPNVIDRPHDNVMEASAAARKKYANPVGRRTSARYEVEERGDVIELRPMPQFQADEPALINIIKDEKGEYTKVEMVSEQMRSLEEEIKKIQAKLAQLRARYVLHLLQAAT